MNQKDDKPEAVTGTAPDDMADQGGAGKEPETTVVPVYDDGSYSQEEFAEWVLADPGTAREPVLIDKRPPNRSGLGVPFSAGPGYSEFWYCRDCPRLREKAMACRLNAGALQIVRIERPAQEPASDHTTSSTVEGPRIPYESLAGKHHHLAEAAVAYLEGRPPRSGRPLNAAEKRALLVASFRYTDWEDAAAIVLPHLDVLWGYTGQKEYGTAVKLATVLNISISSAANWLKDRKS